MGKFAIKKGNNDQYYFSLKADNGQVILASQGYSSRSACRKAIKSVKNNSGHDGMFERKQSSNGKFFFNLKAANGKVIGKSEMYESEASRENGVASVKKNGPKSAEVDE
ncbi:MAG: YegP family protein [Bacteroidales bacterium]|nr:YegP family protein [Bacteroidales bacterium]MBN2762514.1 YegP family protein [Bacteroidales bacterium]